MIVPQDTLDSWNASQQRRLVTKGPTGQKIPRKQTTENNYLPWTWPKQQRNRSQPTLAYNDAPLNQVYSQKDPEFRRRNTNPCLIMSPVTLTLKDSNLIISQDNQAYDDVSPYQVWLQTLSGSDNIQTNIIKILNHQRPWTQHPLFHCTLWLTMTYHQIKSGCKISSSEDTVVQKIQ